MSRNSSLTDRLEVTTIYVNDRTFHLLPEHGIDLNQYLKLQELKVLDNVKYFAASSMNLWLRTMGVQKDIRHDLIERYYGQDAIFKTPCYELLGIPKAIDALSEFNNMLIKNSLPFTFEEVGSTVPRYILAFKQ